MPTWKELTDRLAAEAIKKAREASAVGECKGCYKPTKSLGMVGGSLEHWCPSCEAHRKIQEKLPQGNYPHSEATTAVKKADGHQPTSETLSLTHPAHRMAEAVAMANPGLNGHHEAGRAFVAALPEWSADAHKKASEAHMGHAMRAQLAGKSSGEHVAAALRHDFAHAYLNPNHKYHRDVRKG